MSALRKVFALILVMTLCLGTIAVPAAIAASISPAPKPGQAVVFCSTEEDTVDSACDFSKSKFCNVEFYKSPDMGDESCVQKWEVKVTNDSDTAVYLKHTQEAVCPSTDEDRIGSRETRTIEYKCDKEGGFRSSVRYVGYYIAQTKDGAPIKFYKPDVTIKDVYCLKTISNRRCFGQD